VSVVAPEVYRWDSRLKSARVHWVDAQWRFPPPAINPAGTKHVFTTTVLRQSNQTPCERWLVRYEIVGGPPAGFMPNGGSVVEVPTNTTGQACAEIFQKEPKCGENRINIQVIRPGDLPGANGQRLVVGTGTTSKTWTGADVSVKATGPSAATPGSPLTYRVEVSNPGDLVAKDVVLTNPIPEGLTFLNSNPQAENTGRQLQWRLGELGARQRRSIEINFRSERLGSITNCYSVAAANGLKATDCVATTVGNASLNIRVNGPSQAAVGSQIKFAITITNLSQSAVTGLVIKDRLDPGLESRVANRNNAIEKELGNIAAGATQTVNVTLRVTRPGKLCQNIEVTRQGVSLATTQSCIIANETPGAGAPPLGGQPSGPNARPNTPTFTIKQTCPKQIVAGEQVIFTIEVRNTGTTELRNIEVTDRPDTAITAVEASGGYRHSTTGGLAWTIEQLAPGAAKQLQVKCSCPTATIRACNRVTATTPDGGRVDDEVCIEIQPPPKLENKFPERTSNEKPAGGIALSVVSLNISVDVGKQLTYEIRVKNEGIQPQRLIAVKATVPKGMIPVPIGTTSPDPTKYRVSIANQEIRFDPVPEIGPGETLTYRVRVKATEAGREFRFRAEASALGFPQPLVQETTTEVNEKRPDTSAAIMRPWAQFAA
jgi:uncharacterized repeat protein (TIGR01451 family)